MHGVVVSVRCTAEHAGSRGPHAVDESSEAATGKSVERETKRNETKTKQNKLHLPDENG